jgi:hypothetical protein
VASVWRSAGRKGAELAAIDAPPMLP